jgi:mycothiol synthase
MSLIIRQANLPHDYSAIARVLTLESPEWPTSAEELVQEDAMRDPQFYRAVFVAEDTAFKEHPVVGMASVGHDPYAHREGKFKVNIRVQPNMQGHGVGESLYNTILEHIEPFAPRELYAEVWEKHERAMRFVTERGFVEEWRRIDSTLDVSHFDFIPYDGLEERVNASGIIIKTYDELAHDADRVAKLYALDRTLWEDIPYGEPVTNISLEQFVRENVDAENFVPEACFIAVTETDNTYIGYSKLTPGEGFCIIDMTGMLREYRSKGVATLLKLRGIEYARQHGYLTIRTENDAVNTAVLSLNAKLGFQPQGATIRFVKLMR